MREFIATFHTHLSALMTSRNLNAKGARAGMMPVPRKLSSSCGTCVRFEMPFDSNTMQDEDLEKVVTVEGETFTTIFETEE